MVSFEPPVEFLSICSDRSLQDFALAAQNRAANLRKELRDLADELLRAEAEAMLAGWLRAHRRDFTSGRAMNLLQESFDFMGVTLVNAASARRLEGHRDGDSD